MNKHVIEDKTQKGQQEWKDVQLINNQENAYVKNKIPFPTRKIGKHSKV